MRRLAATALLLLPGGEASGPNLSLIANYLIRFEVTWRGVLLGLGLTRRSWIDASGRGTSMRWLLSWRSQSSPWHNAREARIPMSATGHPRILVLSGVSANNIGDDAMLLACVDDLRALMPDSTIRILADHPEECGYIEPLLGQRIGRSLNDYFSVEPPRAVRKHSSATRLWHVGRGLALLARARLLARRGLESAVPTDYPASTIAEFLEADLVFDVGGASLNEHWKSFFYEKCFSFLLSRALGKKLVLSGQSLEPMSGRIDRGLVSVALRSADLVTFREAVSAAHAAAIGVSGPRFSVTGDDALDLAMAPPSAVDEILAREGAVADRPLIGFQFRNYLELDADDVHRRLASLLDGLIERLDATVVMIPMHYGLCDERKHHGLITQHMRLPDRTLPLVGHYSPMELKGIIGRMALNVGISYHFFVFSVTAGTPILSVYIDDHYSQKMEGLTRLFDLPGHAYAIPTLDVQAFVEHAARVLRDRRKLVDRMRETTADLRQAVLRSRQRSVELLG